MRWRQRVTYLVNLMVLYKILASRLKKTQKLRLERIVNFGMGRLSQCSYGHDNTV